MLSISMTDNVISYKKIKRNAQKNQNLWFYYMNLAPELRNDKKLPNIRITLPRYTQIFVKVWYILDASWWILMSRRFRICVANWGRGYFRPNYGRPKFTLFSKKRDYGKKWFKFGSSNSKIVGVGFFCDNWHLIFLLTDLIWSHSPNFGRPKQGQKN